MKTLFILFTLALSLNAAALTRAEVDRLLAQKQTSLQQLERQGAKLMPGENTGHGKSVAFSKVAVILTDVEAILNREIEAVEFKGVSTLENVELIRYNGQYIQKKDVRAIILLGN